MEAQFASRSLSVQHVWQLLQLRRPALALAMTDRLLAQAPGSVSALLARTEALRQLSRLPEAIATAQQAVAQAPQNPSVFAALARVYGQQGKLWPAVDAIQEALRLNPLAAGNQAFLAQLQYLLHRPDEAVTSAESGLAIDARHLDCLLWRALAQEQLSEPNAADLGFRQLLRLAPNSSLAHAHRGKQLLRRAEPQQAAAHLAMALQLDPVHSAELVPLLRQARREQHWPPWMVQRRQQLRHEWQKQRVLSYRGGNTLLLLPFFWLLGWWLTRHDPLFQLARAQVWQRRLKLWLGLVLLLPVLLLLGDYLHLFDASKPLSMPQMLGLLLGGSLFHLGLYLLRKQIDKQTDF
ncbi:hypothetical protein GO988_16480 [Hymenobacter sp. HMF4947]|uniref:Tetratricopeptide repeat protein n=1 Tax=Hymenobacter ginkgonis TaxID=2682976 RepID=A0A7K1THL6_9BACT|nr:hypothetical protein [Hymenobacter ginkgonis]MVN77927.1 hypothetical protein [Hymenobacter ginkgonis]